MGGTFDHFHVGHEKLLFAAASLCRKKIIIGITSMSMLKKKQYSKYIQSYEERARNVRNYLTIQFPHLAQNIVIEALVDPYGPAITEAEIGAIVVSCETIGGAVKINEIRKTKNLKPCRIVAIRRTLPNTVSSTALRKQKASFW